MKIAFLLDKAQTLQTVFTVLTEAVAKGEQCYVYATCSDTQLDILENLPFPVNNGAPLKGNIQWRYSSTREGVEKAILQEIEDYDAVLGINLFNPIWQSIYNPTPQTTRKGLSSLFGMIRAMNQQDKGDKHGPSVNSWPRIFGMEHSWNEIYNSGNGDNTKKSSLFCNTKVSRQMLHHLGATSEQLESQGSPWLQLCDLFGRHVAKENLVTLLFPHNSWFEQVPGLKDYVDELVVTTNRLCHEKGWQFIAKTRSKYNTSLDLSAFDEVVTDDNAFDHLNLYSKSRIALHFCSSAVCELAFTKTCSVTALPSQNMGIHSRNRRLQRAKRIIHEQYYNPVSFLDSSPFATFVEDRSDIYNTISNLMEQSSEDLNWEEFQERYFPSEKPHHSAGQNVFKRMMELLAN